MTSIQTGIELNDQFSSILYGIIDAVNMTVYAMEEMQQNINMDTSSIEGVRDEIEQVQMAMDELNAAVQAVPEISPTVVTDGTEQVINVDVNPVLTDPLVERPESVPLEVQPNAPPEPVEVPIQWVSDNVEVFTSTGIERFQQEVQSTDNMLDTLNRTQAQIEQTANTMNILPDNAVQEINTVGQRIQAIQLRITQIENNPLNMGTDTANAELEQLRSQLNQMIQKQNTLNQAMQNMDVSTANDAYLRLSQTVGNTERYIRDNVDEQGRFNQEIQEGTQQADNLLNSIKSAIGAYVSIQAAGKGLGLSDELVQTTSRLNMMNDGVHTTEELVNMVYAAAQDARGSFSDMAAVVAKFGNNAGDAFSSSAEVVAFADLVQKQMTIAGASTTEASNTMLQLSQALGSGVLRGDELNSIFEQAPNLIQSIADYLGISIGEIRELASEGELSADVVKAAIFTASDEINAKFNEMPMTWGQVWQSMQNTAMIAFQPVLQRINELANSEGFQTFVNGAIQGMATLANIVLYVFDLLATGATFVSDNWSIIEPIILGIATAFGIYTAALVTYNTVQAITNGLKAIAAFRETAHAAATAMSTGATFTATAAQYGFNAALLACPITWIIAAVLAFVVLLYTVVAWINKTKDTSVSATGIIFGCFAGMAAGVVNYLIMIYNYVATLAEFLLNVFNNPVFAIKKLFANLAVMILDFCIAATEGFDEVATNIANAFIEGINMAISAVNWIIDAINEVLDLDLDTISEFEKTVSITSDLEDVKSNIEDWVGETPEDYIELEKKDYIDVSSWANSGYDFGSNVEDKISNFSLSDVLGSTNIPNPQDYTSQFAEMSDNLEGISGDTGNISDAMDITEEDLKYLRDLAEQETVNRYTVAEINIDQSGMQNNISSGDDIDGFIEKLTDSVNEAVDNMTEGVHE